MLLFADNATYDTLCLGLELGNVKLAIVPVVIKELTVLLEEIGE